MPDDRFVLCIRNDGYQASLERRKIYRLIADSQAESKGMLRLVDESGEDYLIAVRRLRADPGSDGSERRFRG